MKSHLLFLFQFLAPYSWNIALSIFFGVTTITCSVGLMATAAYLLSMASLHPSIAVLQIAIVGVRFFGLFRAVFRYLERLSSHAANLKILGKIRLWIYRTLEPLAPARLMTFHAGDLLARTINDINALELFYVRVLAPSLISLVVITGMVLWLSTFSVLFGLLYLLSVLIVGFILPVIIYHFGKKSAQQLVAERSQSITHAVGFFDALPILSAYNHVEKTLHELLMTAQNYNKTGLKLQTISAIHESLQYLLSSLGWTVILCAAIQQVSANHTPGILIASIVLACIASFESLSPLPQTAHIAQSIISSAERIQSLQQIPYPISSEYPPQILPLQPTVLFQRVSFTYPEQPDPAIEKISFSISPGRHLAVVGPSGAGKTTILHLLLRFLDATDGVITIGENSYSCFTSQQIQSFFSIIPAQTYIFNATLRQNLKLAGELISDRELADYINRVGLTAWLNTLPDSLDTLISNQQLALSAGERQRIGIVRALIKDSPIFLLDEPTAHLDTLTEIQVIQTLQSVLVSKSVVWSTHRLIGMDWMDEILVIDHGKLVQRGTHKELISCQGLYQRMFELQQCIIK